MKEKLLQGPSPHESTDLDKFIDTTEVVFDENGRYTVIYKTYPKYIQETHVDLPTFIGVNVWMDLEDSEEPFDLKYEYYKYIIERKASLGLTHLYISPTQLVDIPSREADLIDNRLLEHVQNTKAYKTKYYVSYFVTLALLALVVLELFFDFLG